MKCVPLCQVTYEDDKPAQDVLVEYASISLDTGVYVGSLYDGLCMLRHGEGTMRFKDGGVYTGEWDSGHMHGHGNMQYYNGSSYIGEWFEGHYHGTGVLTMLSAFRSIDVYRGQVSASFRGWVSVH